MTNVDVRQLRLLQYEDFIPGVQDGRVAWFVEAMLPTGDVDTDELRKDIQQLAIESNYDGYQIDDNRRFFNMGMSASSQEVVLTILGGVASGAAGAFTSGVISYVRSRQSERESQESDYSPPMSLVPDLQGSTGLVKETLTGQFGVSEESISIMSSEIDISGAKVVAKDTERDRIYEASVSKDGLLLEIREQTSQG